MVSLRFRIKHSPFSIYLMCSGFALLIACTPEPRLRGPASYRISHSPDATELTLDASESTSDVSIPTDQGIQGSDVSLIDVGQQRLDASMGFSPDAEVADTGFTDARPAPSDAGFLDAQSAPDSGMTTSICGDGICTNISEDCLSCPADCGPCAWPPAQTTQEDAMVGLVNQLRAMGTSCGGTMYPAVGPVMMNERLRQAARDHSQDMADQNYFAHDSLDGRTPWTRISNAGYLGSPVGENIAAGNSTAQGTFTQWHNSPGHCRNMMNGTANEMGVGYAIGAGTYTHYWTQNFGRR